MAKKASDKKRAKCIADAEKHGLKKAAKMNRVSMQAIRNWQAKSVTDNSPKYDITMDTSSFNKTPASQSNITLAQESLLLRKISLLERLSEALGHKAQLDAHIEELKLDVAKTTREIELGYSPNWKVETSTSGDTISYTARFNGPSPHIELPENICVNGETLKTST